jgi:hypothetical protein
LTPGLDYTRLFISLTAGAGTRCMSLLSSSPSLLYVLFLFRLGEMKRERPGRHASASFPPEQGRRRKRRAGRPEGTRKRPGTLFLDSSSLWPVGKPSFLNRPGTHLYRRSSIQHPIKEEKNKGCWTKGNRSPQRRARSKGP